jgi:hypothetical protein
MVLCFPTIPIPDFLIQKSRLKTYSYKSAKQTADNEYISTVLVGWNTYSNKVDNLDALFESALAQAGDSGFNPATFFNDGTSGNQGNVQFVNNTKKSESQKEKHKLTNEEILTYYKLVFGDNDPLLTAYLTGGNRIQVSDMWNKSDTRSGRPWDNVMVITIDPDASPLESVMLLQKELLDARWTAYMMPYLDSKIYTQMMVDERLSQLQKIQNEIKDFQEIVEMTSSIVCEPVDWALALRDLTQGKYTSAIVATAPVVSTASLKQILQQIQKRWKNSADIILRMSKDTNELIIDVRKGAEVLEGAKIYHYEYHHILFQVMDPNSTSIIKMHGALHRGTNVNGNIGVHDVIMKSMGCRTYKQLTDKYNIAIGSGNKAGFLQDFLDAYGKYFRKSKDYKQIMELIRDAIQKDARLTEELIIPFL